MSSIFTAVLSIVAIAISLASLRLGFTNRNEQRAALVLSKKTELTNKLIETNGKYGHLAMVYAQKILFLTSNAEAHDAEEVERARSNMEIAKQKSEQMLQEHAELLESDNISLTHLEKRL
ncbi:hypothetical protein [Salinisphaera aquimarina]|uniref:DUF2570 domain-containing protein n=1 Tax=Salinisphaera aquimarina TaxID=2094031 RepID=A0ABV7EMQ3_9GAMM